MVASGFVQRAEMAHSLSGPELTGPFETILLLTTGRFHRSGTNRPPASGCRLVVHPPRVLAHGHIEDTRPEKIHYELNADFDTSLMDAEDVQALVAAWQMGAISRDTLLHNFRQGEILPP